MRLLGITALSQPCRGAGLIPGLDLVQEVLSVVTVGQYKRVNAQLYLLLHKKWGYGIRTHGTGAYIACKSYRF